MKSQFEELKKKVTTALEKVKNENDLDEVRQRFLSRKGELRTLMLKLKELSEEQRKEIGAMANKIKTEIETSFNTLVTTLRQVKSSKEKVDVTLPAKQLERGHLHPITIIQQEIEELFISLGFSVLYGPELESDYYNFTALNVPPLHPARDMQDTFYVEEIDDDNKELDLVMRTHTSPAQIRVMKKYGAPLKAIMPGRCFRNESTDARHEHTFYQFEGLMIGDSINFSNIKSILELVGKKLFGADTELRLMPKFYPFVEPGVSGQYTCFLCHGKGCRVCKQTGWLEIVGAGLIHPKVLEAGGIDPNKYSGLAFGFGLTRLAMLKYDVKDVRQFNNGDINFLEQF